MTFINKIKWVLGILVVFLLIVTTNLIDRNNFVRVKDSVETIYEDRLVAKNLLFEMLKSLQKKELAVASKDNLFFENRNKEVNSDLKNYVNKFETTKLTSEEEDVFKDLKSNLNHLESLEKNFVDSDYDTRERVLKQIESIKQNLFDLSEIQLNEGSRQLSIGKKAVDTIELFTQIEIFLLVILAIVIQIIVIYKPKTNDE